MSECSVIQLFPTLCYPMDYSLPGSSVHEIFQVRILERVANFLPSRGPSLPRDGACVFGIMHWQADSLPPHQLKAQLYIQLSNSEFNDITYSQLEIGHNGSLKLAKATDQVCLLLIFQVASYCIFNQHTTGLKRLACEISKVHFISAFRLCLQ